MDPTAALLAPVPAWLVLVLLVLVTFLFVRSLVGQARRSREAVRRLESDRQSKATRYGNLSERFAPWMAQWPLGDPAGFRFIGHPIDGVHFDDDAVYLVEIKSAGGSPTPAQRAVRRAVEDGRVGWLTFYIHESREPDVVRPWE